MTHAREGLDSVVAQIRAAMESVVFRPVVILRV
jgi:hypothetical protein